MAEPNPTQAIWRNPMPRQVRWLKANSNFRSESFSIKGVESLLLVPSIVGDDEDVSAAAANNTMAATVAACGGLSPVTTMTGITLVSDLLAANAFLLVIKTGSYPTTLPSFAWPYFRCWNLSCNQRSTRQGRGQKLYSHHERRMEFLKSSLQNEKWFSYYSHVLEYGLL